MGRRRKTAKTLPPRVYEHHGSYRYVPKTGPKVTLAPIGDHGAMLRALAELIAKDDRPLNTLAQVLDRYLLEVVPGKSPASQANNARELKVLRQVFGAMRPEDLKTTHVAAFRDRRSKKAPGAANREIALLSHVCNKAREWGALETNPVEGLARIKRLPRRRYVTDDEFLAVVELAPPAIALAMQLAYLTGLRRCDVLALERGNIEADVLRCRPSKTEHSTAVELEFELTAELRAVIGAALALEPRVRRAIICNGQGRAYTASGFSSVWQRVMRKAEKAGIERFQFRDIRTKSASDERDAATASERLGHADQSITNRVYRALPRRVRPLK